jgi:hypothetical protein
MHQRLQETKKEWADKIEDVFTQYADDADEVDNDIRGVESILECARSEIDNKDYEAATSYINAALEALVKARHKLYR